MTRPFGVRMTRCGRLAPLLVVVKPCTKPDRPCTKPSRYLFDGVI